MANFPKYEKKNLFSAVFDPLEYPNFVFSPKIPAFCKCRILRILKFDFHLEKKPKTHFFLS